MNNDNRDTNREAKLPKGVAADLLRIVIRVTREYAVTPEHFRLDNAVPDYDGNWLSGPMETMKTDCEYWNAYRRIKRN